MPSINVEKGFQKKAINGAPNETLAEVLKKACQHFKVDPGSHVLKYKKKDLDLTLSIRFANLPPGAAVELCELDEAAAKKRVVVVALQQEDGQRVQAEVECSMTLAGLLKKFEDLCSARLITGTAERGEIPRVIFMNKAYDGEEQLGATTLVQLGVVSGSVLMRHSLQKSAGDAMPAESAGTPATGPPSQSTNAPPTQAAAPTLPNAPNVQSPAPAAALAASQPAMQIEQADSMGAGSTVQDPNAETEEGAEESGPRDFKVGRPRPGHADQTVAEVDDSFFELTAEDIGMLEQSKKQKQKEVGFKTKLMREREREAKLSKFKHVPVRVTFPDQTWIQARFAATDTLAGVYALVREALVAPERAFHLFLTPPPKKLPDASQQIKYTELLPSAKLYFSWSDAPGQEGPFMKFAHMEQIEKQEAEAEASEQMDGLEEGSSGLDAASREPEEGAGGMDVEGDDSAAAGARVGGGGGGNVLGSRGGAEQAEEGGAGRAAALKAAEGRAEGPKKPKWFKMK